MILTATSNPKAWRGLKYPDSDLVGLVYRYARPGRDVPATEPFALDAGCGAGRHMRFLQDLGYHAAGIDSDVEMIEAARHNGLDVQLADARGYRPDRPPDLAVCWGFMMVVDDGPAVVASWSPQIIIADWRPRTNSCFQWPGNRPLPGGAVHLRRPGHLLHDLTYHFHDLAECAIPGYRRVHWQHIAKHTADESNEWIQTVFQRI